MFFLSNSNLTFSESKIELNNSKIELRNSNDQVAPKATVQQSRPLLLSPSDLDGLITATGSIFCRGSHSFTSPSLLPVTISGAPSPMLSPPTPSIALMISLWPFTWYTGISGCSKFLQNLIFLCVFYPNAIFPCMKHWKICRVFVHELVWICVSIFVHHEKKLRLGTQYSRTFHISTVTWFDFCSGAILLIRTFESPRMTQHSRNRVTWLPRSEGVYFIIKYTKIVQFLHGFNMKREGTEWHGRDCAVFAWVQHETGRNRVAR